jgi:uracil-DNA glycosylase
VTTPFPFSWDSCLDPPARAALERVADHIENAEVAGLNIYPPAPARFRALELTLPPAVKIVLLGQDPYHRPGQAMGLSFSVPRGIAPPRSLQNIFRELDTDLGIDQPAHGDLTAWAMQGVLLLNTSLSVEEGRAGSHSKIGWQTVTQAILRHAAHVASRPIVFLCWGKHAEAAVESIDGRHRRFSCAHPSPLSAARGFFGCRHFSRANQYLAAQGTEPIDWSLSPIHG